MLLEDIMECQSRVPIGVYESGSVRRVPVGIGAKKQFRGELQEA